MSAETLRVQNRVRVRISLNLFCILQVYQLKPEELSCERELGLSRAQQSNVLKVNERTSVSATRDSWGPGHYMITLATEEAGKGAFLVHTYTRTHTHTHT